MRRDHTAVALAIAALIWCGDPWLGSQPSAHSFPWPGVCLDAGHGGSGACKWTGDGCTNGDGFGCYGPNGLTEAWVNHAILSLAMGDLAAVGIVAHCTKTNCNEGDITQYVGPRSRALIANSKSDVDVLISLHHQDIGIQKTEVYYAYTNDSNVQSTWKYKLASAVGAGIKGQFNYPVEVKNDTYSHLGSLDVLQYAAMPAALSEGSDIGFLSEETLMASSNSTHRQAEADGIRGGVFAYCDSTRPEDFFCVDYTYQAEPRVALTWDEVPLATGYDFCWSTMGCTYMQFDPDFCEDVGNTTIIWRSSTFMRHPGYCFGVRAYAADRHYVGGFSWMNGFTCTTGIDRIITNFSASSAYRGASLTWHATGFESYAGFEIWRSTDGGRSYDDSLGYVQYYPQIGDYYFEDNSAQYSMSYCYKIRDTEGYAWWGPACALAQGNTQPPVPSPTPDLGVTRVKEYSVHLCLESGSENAEYYLISWKPDGGAWVDSVKYGEKCFDWSSLQYGLVYDFRAQGVNWTGSTGWSPEVSARTMYPPTNLCVQGGYERIYLWWDAAEFASGYKVCWKLGEFSPENWTDVGDTTAATLGGLVDGQLYTVYIVAYDEFGNETEASNLVHCAPGCEAGVEGDLSAPTESALGQNHPNPFGLWTGISYALAEPCTRVKLAVYDAAGREIRRLVDKGQPAREYEVGWDGRDGHGQSVPPGVYFCRLEAGRFSKTVKMLRVK